MEAKKKQRLSREDWLSAALELSTAGIDQVKVAPLAAAMGVTTGSFYWHFKNRQQLLDSLLEFWEHEKTDIAIDRTTRFEASPADRILFLMQEITKLNLARYDLPIWVWAQWDTKASTAFSRVLRKRFSFVSSLFSAAGFSKQQAEVRAHIMVVYFMGQATLLPDSFAKRNEFLNLKHAILTAPEKRIAQR